MRFKKLIALVSAVSMLGAMTFALPATAKTETLLDHPMNSEEAVNALIGESTKYEPMVAMNSGTAANITLSYVKAGGTTSCMNMTDNNNWYNSSGLKYDITDLVADKSGALTISANVSANQATNSIQIGFMNDSGTKVACDAASTTSTEFISVSYTAEAIPSYTDKLYFYVTTGKPTLRITSLTLTLTTPDPVATLPINDATFTAGSIPNYYSTTGTGGLSVSNGWLIAKNVTTSAEGATTDANINANSEFITINLDENQLKAGDKLDIGFTYSNGNGSTQSAANVSLDCGGTAVEVGSTDAIAGNRGSTTASFSGTVEIPASYTSGAVKVVLKVSASTAGPRIKDVAVSKVEAPATHEEGFKFNTEVTLAELNSKTFKITRKIGEEEQAGTYTPGTVTSGDGEAVIGLIITEIPEGVEITRIDFE